MGEAAQKIRLGWDDYRQWSDDERWEIIGGEAFAMSPAPTLRHQTILFELSCRFGDHFNDHPCKTSQRQPYRNKNSVILSTASSTVILPVSTVISAIAS